MQHKSIHSDQIRILRIYSDLLTKQTVSISDIADFFFVSHKTIQRDINTIRKFILYIQAEHNLDITDPIFSEIIFDRQLKAYRLTNADNFVQILQSKNN